MDYPELGCVPGGLIDPENLELDKREREKGLWVWEWWSYENEIRWWQIEAQSEHAGLGAQGSRSGMKCWEELPLKPNAVLRPDVPDDVTS
jgi:hypothetical protein